MNKFFRNFSLIFAAGAFGGLVKAMVAWGFGAAGLNAALGFKNGYGVDPHVDLCARGLGRHLGLLVFLAPPRFLLRHEARYTAWPRR